MNNDQKLVKKLQSGALKGVIFDFDGTLLDISEPLRQSIEEVFIEKKIQTDMELTIQEIGALLETVQAHPLPKIVLESYELFKYITALKEISFLKKLRIAIKIFSKYLTYSKEAPLFSGTKVLLKKLSDSYDLYIISHNKTESILNHLKKEGIEKFFTGVYGTDKLPALKPSADAFKPVLEHYKTYKKEEFLMIGDMPTDIEAGQEAGFWTIGIASGISKKEVLAEYSPDILVDSLIQLIELIKGRIPNSKVKKTITIKS